MDIIELQNAIGTKVDGIWGPESRDALLNAFTNPSVAAVSAEKIDEYAQRLGVSAKQVRAVAQVESSGGAFDGKGRPKILFERHKFHKYTGGKWSVCAFSNPKGGGYNESSWDKLNGAIITNAVDAAFMSCSWGKFQVLGEWWDELDYPSPFAMAHSTTVSEAGHYDMLCRYIEHFKLQDEMKALSTDANKCVAFASAYNGAGFKKFEYHTKLAKAMA